MKINYKSQFTNYNEKRSHPELNPFISAWDYVDKYKDDPDVYISFTQIDKIGLNPQSTYNTPLGIYTYPLKEFVKEYLSNPKYVEVAKYKMSIGDHAPFAGNAKYINFIRVKDKAHFIEDMYTDYTSKNYDRDIKTLEKIYSSNSKFSIMEKSSQFTNDFFDIIQKVRKEIINYDIILDRLYNYLYLYIPDEYSTKLDMNIATYFNKYRNNIIDLIYENKKEEFSKIIKDFLIMLGIPSLFSEFIKNGVSSAKAKNPVMMMWNITRLLAEKLSNNSKQASTKWNLILSKDLGYSGFADKSGKGYIHPSEPMQAVFLNTRAFTLLHRVENTKAKSVASNKDIIIRKLMDIAMIGEERKEDFELNLLFSKDEKKIIRYKGNFRIEKINVKEMPYQIEEIDGSFYAKNVKLTSFKNFPIEIKKDLYLVDLPYIDSLKGITEYVHGDLFIDKNLLDIFGEKQIRDKCNIKGDIIIY